MTVVSFPYVGSKVTLAPKIVDLLPAHGCYVEPFAGSLAVLLAKPSAPVEVVNDTNANIVTFYRMLRDRHDDLVALLRNTPYARDELEHAHAVVNGHVTCDDDLERARCWYVACSQAFSGNPTQRGLAWGHNVRNSDTAQRRIDQFHTIRDRLTRVVIENRDALTVLNRADSRDTVGYLDPPYTHDSRSAGAYIDDGDDELHERIAEFIGQADGTYLLAGYAGPLYDRLFGDLWSVSFQTRQTVKHAGDDPSRVEIMWCNRPLPGFTGPDGTTVADATPTLFGGAA